MEKLYPIIRRVRRSLLPPDEPVSREGAKAAKVEEVKTPEEKQNDDADETPAS